MVVLDQRLHGMLTAAPSKTTAAQVFQCQQEHNRFSERRDAFFTDAEVPVDVFRLFAVDPAEVVREESKKDGLQSRWTTILKNNVFQQSQNVLIDSHAIASIGSRKPDLVVYATDSRSVSHIVALGDIKSAASGDTGRVRFSDDEMGQILDYCTALFHMQPDRTTVFCFLTDYFNIQFYKVTVRGTHVHHVAHTCTLSLPRPTCKAQAVRTRSNFELKEMQASPMLPMIPRGPRAGRPGGTCGLSQLLGMLQTDAATLGYELPPQRVEGHDLGDHELLGIGAQAVAYSCTLSGSSHRVVLKHAIHDRSSLILEQFYLTKVQTTCSAAAPYVPRPILHDVSQRALVTMPVAQQLAHRLRDYFVFFRKPPGEPEISILYREDVATLTAVLALLHTRVGVVHRDLRLSNLLRSDGQVGVHRTYLCTPMFLLSACQPFSCCPADHPIRLRICRLHRRTYIIQRWPHHGAP